MFSQRIPDRFSRGSLARQLVVTLLLTIALSTLKVSSARGASVFTIDGFSTGPCKLSTAAQPLVFVDKTTSLDLSRSWFTHGKRETRLYDKSVTLDNCSPGGAPYQCSFMLGALTGYGEEAPGGHLSFAHAMIFNEWFDPACARHDHCYRFGWMTYGFERQYCDDEFYNMMVDICESTNWVTVAVEVLTGGLSLAACRLGAAEYYEGAHQLGEGGFHKEDGRCCEYLADLKQAPDGSLILVARKSSTRLCPAYEQAARARNAALNALRRTTNSNSAEIILW